MERAANAALDTKQRAEAGGVASGISLALRVLALSR